MNKAKAKKQEKRFELLKSLHGRFSSQLKGVTKDCKEHRRITKENREAVREMYAEHFRFKYRWLFNYRGLTSEERKLNNNKLERYTRKLEKCRTKSLKYKTKWNKHFQGRIRHQKEKN